MKHTKQLSALVDTSKQKEPTVNARDLHAFLEAPTRFNDWIVSRIREYGFTAGQDFVTFTEKPVKGRPTKEYHLSLDMAKELAMVERNEKGRQARQYFIECEKKLAEVRESIEALSLEVILNALQKRMWDPSLPAGTLGKLLPTGRYGEVACNGKPRIGLQRACWKTTGRLRDAAVVVGQLQLLELSRD